MVGPISATQCGVALDLSLSSRAPRRVWRLSRASVTAALPLCRAVGFRAGSLGLSEVLLRSGQVSSGDRLQRPRQVLPFQGGLP